MKKQSYITRTSLWLARIWGTLVLGFVLFFLIAHLFNPEETSGNVLSDPKELVTFICFPILTITGLAIAYKWEGTGGLISCIALLFAMVLNKTLDLKFLLLIFPPGLLYLIYWYFSTKERVIRKRMKLH